TRAGGEGEGGGRGKAEGRGYGQKRRQEEWGKEKAGERAKKKAGERTKKKAGNRQRGKWTKGLRNRKKKKKFIPGAPVSHAWRIACWPYSGAQVGPSRGRSHPSPQG